MTKAPTTAPAAPAAREGDLLAPLRGVEFIPRDDLRANDYNPNRVNEENLRLLTQSILSNGWTLPIVARSDRTIIDGYHRWTVAGREPLLSRLGGLVPVVTVDHGNKAGDVYGTITHNRARGTHLLEPMQAIVQELLGEGKSVAEIGRETGMKPEEVFRLAGFTREQFLERMIGDAEDYSAAQYIVDRKK